MMRHCLGRLAAGALWCVRMVWMCISACFYFVFDCFAHTRCFRRWKRRFRKMYQFCAKLCCRCCECGRASARKYDVPEFSDSGESSDGDGTAGRAGRRKRQQLGDADDPFSASPRKKSSFAVGAEFDGLPSGRSQSMGVVPAGVLLVDSSGSPRRRTASAVPKKLAFALDFPSGRPAAVVVGGSDTDEDLELGYAGEDKAMESKALVAGPRSVWEPPEPEAVRTTKKQASKGPYQPLVKPPPGMLDTTELVLFHSLECMSPYVAVAYESVAAGVRRRRPTCWQRYACSCCH